MNTAEYSGVQRGTCLSRAGWDARILILLLGSSSVRRSGEPCSRLRGSRALRDEIARCASSRARCALRSAITSPGSNGVNVSSTALSLLAPDELSHLLAQRCENGLFSTVCARASRVRGCVFLCERSNLCATVDAASSSICWLAEQPCVPCVSAPLGQR